MQANIDIIMLFLIFVCLTLSSLFLTFSSKFKCFFAALGVVGACFRSDVWASIIVDGIHCDFESVKLAKQLKGEKLFLITDAVTADTSGPYYFDKRGGDKFVDDTGFCNVHNIFFYIYFFYNRQFTSPVSFNYSYFYRNL